MRLGKLPTDLLARLLGAIPAQDPRVTVGPRPGEDAAVINLAGQGLVVTTDPITFTSAQAAWYAVQVNANDVAAMGGEPAWLAATLLLPPRVEEIEVESLFTQLGTACEELGVTIVTGHTEITDAVTRPVVVGTMLGLLGAAGAITSGGAVAGDAVIIAGPLAIEGTVILAADAAPALSRAGIPEVTLAEARGFLTDPGISIVRAGRIIRSIAAPHAMHDATEGGVATALREVTTASGVGLILHSDHIPILPQTRDICAALGLDPLGLISSGCLVAAIQPGDAQIVVEALAAAGIVAAQAGTFTEATAMLIEVGGTLGPLAQFDRDELARYFEGRA